MMRVIFILVAQRRIDQVRRNFFQRCPNPKLLVGTQGDPEQFAVAVTHALRKRNPIKQRRLWQSEPKRGNNCTKDDPITQRAAQIANCWGAHAPSVLCSAPSPNTRTFTISRPRESRWRGRQRQQARAGALPSVFGPRTHSVTVILPPRPRPFTL